MLLKEGSGVPQKRKKNSWRHQTEVEGSSLGGRVGVGVVRERASRNCSQRGLTAGSHGGSREMH